ncbi:MAG: EAL domain-containing protein [Xanthomonadaceae bacterium]|nr:EAL domain-containing protein [Xanthomonadaceae bacterium]
MSSELPASHLLTLLLAVLVLALAGTILANHRRRDRLQREHMQAMREREQRLRLSLWASNELYWQYDLRTRALEKTRVLPDQANDLIVQSVLDADPQIHPDDLPAVNQQLRDYLQGHHPMFMSEHRMRGDDGQWQWVLLRGRAVEQDADGRVVRIAGTARNVDSLREQENQRQIAAMVMHSMAESVAVLDADFNFVTVNPAFSQMSGYHPEDVLNENLALLDSPRQEAQFYRDVRAAVHSHGSWAGNLWQQRKDGSQILCASQCSQIDQPSGARPLFVLVASDITERHRIEQELRYLANFDTLTGLPNRTLLAERLSRAIVRARRERNKLALLFLDLDNFKDVNDTLGHATGDRVLRAAAQRLQEVVGEGRTVARVSGDEFTAVLEDLNSREEAEACAQRILTAFDAPLKLDDRLEFTITPSIGISLFPEHAQVPTDLLKFADTAMYHAKAAGKRASMCYTDSMAVDLRRRAHLTTSLRRVVERGELQLVFQPQQVLGNGRIEAVEALLRWNSPEHGQIPPAQFIPLAEDCGAIIPIGDWVLQEACRTLAAWHRAGVDPQVSVSVNVSALQFLRSDLSQSVSAALAQSGLSPSALELELTESVLMANAEAATERLQDFRKLGVSIAVDDFGTGYSSLAYLHRLPINTLKIDKAFIDGLLLSGDSEDTTITTTIIAMAKTLGLLVVAEGVETPEQLAFLQQQHCDLAQGYLISPPMAADACLQFLLEAQDNAGAAAVQLDPGALPA